MNPPPSNETTSVYTDINDDQTFNPNSDTNLTEAACPPGHETAKRRIVNTKRGTLNENKNVSSVELLYRTHYEDPADDTDEDLSKVPEDYGKNNQLRLTGRWAR